MTTHTQPAAVRAPERPTEHPTVTEVHEVGEGSITLAVVIEDGGLVVVLRARGEPDVQVRVPVDDDGAVYLTRALAGSLRYLHRDATGCPACDPRWRQP